MATEADELRLTVTLVDNASAGLMNLRRQVEGLGGGAAAQAMQQFGQHAQNASRSMNPLIKDFENATKQLLPFVRGIGGAATGLLTFAYLADKGTKALGEYAKELSDLNALSSQTGITAGTLKGMREQMEASGIAAGKADANLRGLSSAMSDLTKVQSQIRQQVLQAQLPENRIAMESFLGDLGRLIDHPEEFANRVKEAGDTIFENVKTAFGPERAAEARRNWLNVFGMPDLDQVIGKFREVSAEEKARQDARDQAARQYLKLTTEIEQSWKHVTDSWFNEAITQSPLMDAMKFIKGVLDSYAKTLEKVDEVNKQHPAPEGFWQKLNPFNPQNVEREKALRPELHPPGGPPIKVPENYQPPQYQHGGMIERNMLGFLHAGEMVTPASGVGALEDQTRATRELTAQMEKLTTFLMGTMTARMGGLAPGFGVGPGVVSAPNGSDVGPGTGAGAGGFGGMLAGLGGGGGIGGMLGGIGDMLGGIGLGGIGRILGPGGGMGGRAAAGTAATAGGTGDAGASGPAGDPSVPSDILSRARQVALAGGPSAVKQFMRSQGYPKAGNWCGEFAASVVKSVGGTPPKDAAIASNWRRWGAPVEGAPQAGDVAVRNDSYRGTGYVPTGATGSHVTFVEGYDPKTGTFTGLGGNQSAGFESRFKASGYTFRRATGPANPAVASANAAATTAPVAVTSAATPLGGTNAAIAQERARVMRQLQEPGMRELTAGVIAHEQEGGAGRADVLESLVNRAVVTGKHPRDLINSGFYGPVNRGEIRGKTPEWALKDYDAAAAAVAAGRNALGGRTDQGMLKEVAAAGRVGIRGEYYGWMGLRGEHETAAARTDRAAIDRSMTHTVTGTGTIDVNVNAPRNTFVKASAGGLFKRVNVTRQAQMTPAAGGSVAMQE